MSDEHRRRLAGDYIVGLAYTVLLLGVALIVAIVSMALAAFAMIEIFVLDWHNVFMAAIWSLVCLALTACFAFYGIEELVEVLVVDRMLKQDLANQIAKEQGSQWRSIEG